MISLSILSESLYGIWSGVRDGNLKGIYNNTKDTIGSVVRGTVNTVGGAARLTGGAIKGTIQGANAVKNGAVTAGQHIARNKDNYLIGSGLAAGAGGLAYWLHHPNNDGNS